MNSHDFNMRLVRLGKAISELQSTELTEEQRLAMTKIDIAYWDVVNGWIDPPE